MYLPSLRSDLNRSLRGSKYNQSADYVITEYGVARLWGKTLRKRAEELISIAHPDFRSELKKEVQY